MTSSPEEKKLQRAPSLMDVEDLSPDRYSSIKEAMQLYSSYVKERAEEARQHTGQDPDEFIKYFVPIYGKLEAEKKKGVPAKQRTVWPVESAALPSTKGTAEQFLAQLFTDSGDIVKGSVIMGSWRDYGLASPPRPKVENRVQQLLSELSVALLETFAVKGDFEFECMEVNGRVLACPNKAQSSEKATGGKKNLQGVITGMQDVIAASKKAGKKEKEVSVKDIVVLKQIVSILDPSSGPVDEDAINRMGRLLHDVSSVDDTQKAAFISVLNVIKKNLKKKPIAGGDAGKIAKWITDSEHAGALMVMTPAKEGFHSEQNLLLAYLKSGASAPVIVAGTKRPCTGCYLSYRLAELSGLPVEFGHRPGGAWAGATGLGLTTIAGALGIGPEKLKEIIQQELTSAEFNQWLTGNEGDEPEEIKSNLFGIGFKASKKKTPRDKDDEGHRKDRSRSRSPRGFGRFARRDQRERDEIADDSPMFIVPLAPDEPGHAAIDESDFEVRARPVRIGKRGPVKLAGGNCALCSEKVSASVQIGRKQNTVEILAIGKQLEVNKKAVAKETSMILEDGDIFTVGHYRFLVSSSKPE
ncbi:hypothetical protein [Streptomyces sp. NPDC047028]|uniref:hypothetical protein n=1 Tax=Streptomyces sp. NPDC047028 TaxID=3155793 RepID=UPI0033FD5D24